MSVKRQQSYRFDSFQLDAANRQLRRDGEIVPLPAKAFDLLLALVENQGRLVSKDELFHLVWHDQIVEESNLTVHISAIRKALGETKKQPHYIMTVPGFGYRFDGEVLKAEDEDELLIETHTLSRIVIERETAAHPTEPDNELPLADVNALTMIQAHSGFAPQITPKPLSEDVGFAERVNGAATMRATGTALPQAEGKKLRQRRAFVWLAGGLLLALLAVGSLLYWRSSSTPKKQTQAAATPFAPSAIRQLTTKGNVSLATLSPDGKFYAYSLVERGGFRYSLWLGQTEGSNEIQLRPPEGLFYNSLAFSSDSRTLYFATSAYPTTPSTLYKMPVLGGVPEKLFNKVGIFLSLSPDDRQIAFFRTDKEASTLVIANLDGTGEREVLRRPLNRAFAPNAPGWSPDGSMLAVAAISENQHEEVLLVQAQDGNIKQLTTLAWGHVLDLVWRRDGESLIAVARERGAILHQLWQIDYPSGNTHRISRDVDSYGSALSLSTNGSVLAIQERGESNIWVAPAAGLAQARQVTFGSIGGVYGWNGLDWTPDGKILFTGAKDQGRVIYAMDADGSNLKQLTSAGFFDQRLSVTTDGRFIVFQSDRSGEPEIWRANSDGSDLQQLTTGGGNTTPYPTPDGKWVVYTSFHDGIRSICRIPLMGGESVRLSEKDLSYPRVSPDGKLIACIYHTGDGNPGQVALLEITGGEPVKLFDVPRSVAFHDGIRWTPDGKAVCYRDWGGGIWKQEIAGGTPRRLAGLPEEAIPSYGWSRDGKQFAFTRARSMRDAVLIHYLP